MTAKPNGWVPTRFGEMAHVDHGWPFKSPEYSTDPQDPVVVSIGNFDYTGGFRFDRSTIKHYAGAFPGEFTLKAGDLLLVMTCQTEGGEILGVPGVVPDDGRVYLHNQRIGRVHIDRPDLLDAKFAFHLARWDEFNRQLAVTATGSKILHTSPARIEATTFASPPLVEQRAIAEVLGALDDKIAANTRLATKSEALAIALAAASEPSTPLDDLVGVSRTMVDPSLMTVTVVKHYSLPAFDANHAPESVSPSEIKSGKFLIGRPAVLLSKLNPRFPRAWDIPVVPEDPSLASTEFVVLHPVGFSTTVLWALVSQPRFGSALEGMVAGTSGSHQRVRPADMLATPVGDPRSMPEALKKQITVLGSSATMARAENLTLVATRDALLPALMSGALRVRDAERAVERTV